MIAKLGFIAALSLTAAFALTSPGCSDVKRIYNCNQICDKYKECVDTNYDDSACSTRCEDAAKDNQVFEDKADDCQNCIDDKSCVASVFQCGAQCAGIVP